MKLLRFRKKRLCQTIRTAIMAFLIATCLRPAAANPTPAYSPDFTVNGGTVANGSDTTSAQNSYFYDGTTNGYTVTIAPSAKLDNTNSGYTNLIQFDHGTVTNSGSLYANQSGSDAIHLGNTTGSNGPLTDIVTNTASGYIYGSKSGVYVYNDIYGTASLSSNITLNNAGYITSGNYAVGLFAYNEDTTGDVTNNLTLNNLSGATLGDNQSSYGAELYNDNDELNGSSKNTIAIMNSGSIYGSGQYGIDAYNTDYFDNYYSSNTNNSITDSITLNNASSITAHGTNSYGAYLSNYNYADYYNAQVTNTIQVNNSSAGTIQGTNSGLYLLNYNYYYTGYYTQGASLSSLINLNNAGRITSSETGAYLENYNEYSGSYYNLGSGSLSSALNITNTASGYLQGDTYGVHAYNYAYEGYTGSINQSISLKNDGQIVASNGDGAYLYNFSEYNSYAQTETNQIFVGNTGTISGRTGLFAQNESISDGSLNSTQTSGITLNNSGTITASTGDAVDLENTLSNNTGTGTATIQVNNSGLIQGADSGLYLQNSVQNGSVSATVNNTGQITGSNYGISANSDNTHITSSGGGVSGGTDAILLGGSNSSLTIQGRSNIQGTMEGSGNSGNSLTLNISGMTPAQATALTALSGSSSGTYALGATTYTWADFQNVTINAISLEQVVAPRFVDLARKIDNGGLPLYTGVGSAGAAFDPFFVQASSDPNGAFNTLTGLILTQGTQSLVTNANQSLLSQWGSQLESNFGAAGGFDLTSFTMSTDKMAAFNDASTQLGHLVDMASTDAGPMLIPTTDNNRWGAWLTGNVTVADADSNTSNGQTGYHAVNGSPTLGFDYQMSPEWKVGALASASINGAHFDDGSKIDSNTELLGLYSTWAHEHWRVHGIAAGGMAQYDNQRNAFGTNANSKPTGYDALAESTVGYEIPIGGGFKVTPEVGLQYTHVNQGSYTENGAGALDLSVNSQDYDSLRTHLGGKLDKSFDITHDLKFMPEFRAAWYHEVLNQSHSVTSSLAGAPTIGSFSTQTSNPQRDYGLIGVGLNTAFTGYGAPVGLFINYDVQVGQNDYIEHDVTGGIRVAF